MAAYTQIIDLYGIPACGKSTLAQYMASHPVGGLKVAAMTECILAARKDKWKWLRSLSLRDLFASIRLKYAATLDKKRKVIPLWKVIIMGWFKNYVRKFTDYDIVVTDHGDIQSFVSLERGDNLHESKKFRDACQRYLDVSLSTTYVYCKVTADVALRRMNGRGRSAGRIDLMEDQSLKLQELEKEIICFDYWTSLLKDRKSSLFELNMDDATSVIAERLFNSLQTN